MFISVYGCRVLDDNVLMHAVAKELSFTCASYLTVDIATKVDCLLCCIVCAWAVYWYKLVPCSAAKQGVNDFKLLT